MRKTITPLVILAVLIFAGATRWTQPYVDLVYVGAPVLGGTTNSAWVVRDRWTGQVWVNGTLPVYNGYAFGIGNEHAQTKRDQLTTLWIAALVGAGLWLLIALIVGTTTKSPPSK